MNERVTVAQLNNSQLADLVRTHVVRVTKPQSDQAVVVDLNNGNGATLDLSAVANEKMSLVHVDSKLVILFDNQSTVTAEPFFDLSGKPLAGLNVELSAGRTINGEQFAQRVPITDDQSVLPASDPSSGADFRDASIDSLPGTTSPLALMAEDTEGNFGRGSADTGADFGVVAHAQLFSTPASTIIGSAPGIGNIPAPGGAGTQVFEAGLLASRGPGESDGTHAGNPAFQTTTRAGTISFTSLQSRMTGTTAAFRSQAEEDLAKSRGDLAVLDETIKLARDRFRRAELRSPVNGVVNKINVTTVGAVIQPGADVMDIVPLDDTLLVESRIRPQDIAFIHPEQDAVVKLTAYDSSVFGSLIGKVERISADTIVNDKPDRDEKNEKFYRVMIRTDKNHLGSDEHPLPIIPGMVATVEVLTGHKSVLDYMIKPARLLRDEALRER